MGSQIALIAGIVSTAFDPIDHSEVFFRFGAVVKPTDTEQFSLSLITLQNKLLLVVFVIMSKDIPRILSFMIPLSKWLS